LSFSRRSKLFPDKITGGMGRHNGGMGGAEYIPLSPQELGAVGTTKFFPRGYKGIQRRVLWMESGEPVECRRRTRGTVDETVPVESLEKHPQPHISL